MKKTTVQAIPFKLVKALTLVANTPLQVVLQPATFPRILDIADTYECFRVLKCRFRLQVQGTATVIASGFYPGVTDTAPASAELISENTYSSWMGSGQTIPSTWETLPKAILAGYFPWYKTVAGTPDPSEEAPGSWYTVSTASSTAYLEVQGVFEFKGPVNSGATPMERARLAAVREKQRLLQILSAPDLPVAKSDSNSSGPTPTAGFAKKRFTEKELQERAKARLAAAIAREADDQSE